MRPKHTQLMVINVAQLKTTGYAVSDWLYAEKAIGVELADEQRIMALLTLGDTEERIDVLIDGLKAAAQCAKAQPKESVVLPALQSIRTEAVMNPRDAFFAPAKDVPLAISENEICAEIISPYPPGIPRLLPGERITRPIIEYFQQGLKAGMHILDANDQKLHKVRVVNFSR